MKQLETELPEILELFLSQKKENYNKEGRFITFCSKNYIEYQSSGDKNKTPSIKDYLD